MVVPIRNPSMGQIGLFKKSFVFTRTVQKKTILGATIQKNVNMNIE